MLWCVTVQIHIEEGVLKNVWAKMAVGGLKDIKMSLILQRPCE